MARRRWNSCLLPKIRSRERRAQFIASFNRGYRSFEGTYTNCTASATEAIGRYTVEGESLARDIAARYGN